MHIPDGFLNLGTAAATGVVSAGAIAGAVRETGKQLKEKQVPIMGVLAAFIFAAQMLNFPIVGGTSGHFMGAALAAIILGPWAGVLIMSCVLIAQCLIFQDGGLVALGANIFNMGIVGSFSSYFIYKFVVKVIPNNANNRLIGGFIGAWVAIVLAATACAIELAVSGASPMGVVLPAMTGVHALIGIVEGLVTVAVLGAIKATRADLLEPVKFMQEGATK